MPIPNPFKLEKLRITVVDAMGAADKLAKTFDVMFNPESFQMRHGNKYVPQSGINSGDTPVNFTRKNPDELNLKLLFDGTGVTDMGVTSFTSLATKSVSDQISAFLDVCFHKQGEKHEPNTLKIDWGKGPIKDFRCRLESVEIDYTAFDRDGAPLRAVLNTTFIHDIPVEEAVRVPEQKSPDVTHARIVKASDTLPLLCKEIYGSTRYYLQVAQVNRLDDFRHLTPGKTLIFPPLES